MELQAVDGSKLLVLMIAGAVIAAAGLYLMLKPRPEDAAKIEIFGLKFESSSAGLLVFVIGAAFLAVPLFAPERSVREAPEQVTDNGVVEMPAATTGRGAALLVDTSQNAQPSPSAQRNEEEPNDGIDSAERLMVGQSITGSIPFSNTATDWFVLDLSGETGTVEMRLRRNSSRGVTNWIVFDAREQKLEAFELSGNTRFVRLDAGQSTVYYLQGSAGNSNWETRYEVSLYPVAAP